MYEDLLGGFTAGGGLNNMGTLGNLMPGEMGGSPLDAAGSPLFDLSGFQKQGLPGFIQALGALQQPKVNPLNIPHAPAVAPYAGRQIGSGNEVAALTALQQPALPPASRALSLGALMGR